MNDEPIRCFICDLPIIDIGIRSEVFWVHEHNRRRTCPNTIATPPRRPLSAPENVEGGLTCDGTPYINAKDGNTIGWFCPECGWSIHADRPKLADLASMLAEHNHALTSENVEEPT